MDIAQTATVRNIQKNSNLSKYFHIVRELAISDFRLKYHDSALGYIWSMLNPILMFGIYYFVFTKIFPSTIQYYALFLLTGIVSYNFFSDFTFSAMSSLGAKSGLMKKTYFPRSIIIFSAATTSIISYIINLMVLLIIVLVLKGFSPYWLLLPIPILCLIMFSLGVSFFIATLYAYFRDMGQIWGVLLIALFWTTPVVFDVNSLPPSIQTFVYFNPLTRIFGLLRHYIIYEYFDLRFLIMTVVYSLLSLIIGFFIFRKYEDKFAELFS